MHMIQAMLLYPYREYDGFELDSLELDECLANFRVNKADLPRLAAALRIPARFRCHQANCMQWT